MRWGLVHVEHAALERFLIVDRAEQSNRYLALLAFDVRSGDPLLPPVGPAGVEAHHPLHAVAFLLGDFDQHARNVRVANAKPIEKPVLQRGNVDAAAAWPDADAREAVGPDELVECAGLF
jgi:hypothetical protein